MKSASLLCLTLVLVGGAKAQDASPTPTPQYPTDWTTNDGQHLHKVKVLKVDSDFVTVIHSDGGGIIPLSSLTPDIQHLFNYPHKYITRLSRGGIKYKDIVVGSGLSPSPSDQVTVTLKPSDDSTTNIIKTAVDAETKRLTTLKTTSDTAITDAQTKYDAASGSDKQLAYNTLQAAQKKAQDISVKMEALQSNTVTFSFGAPDFIAGLGEIVSNMKPGGKRDVNPLPPPAPPSDDNSTPSPTPTPVLTPTPTPTPTPVSSVPPPPQLSYEVDVIDVQPNQ